MTPTITIPDDPLTCVAFATANLLVSTADRLVGRPTDPELTARNAKVLARGVPELFSAIASAATSIGRKYGCAASEEGQPTPPPNVENYNAAAADMRQIGADVLLVLHAHTDDVARTKALAGLRGRWPSIGRACSSLLGLEPVN